MGTAIEQPPRMAEKVVGVASEELGEEVDVHVEGMSEHEGVDLEEGGFRGLPLLEKMETFSLDGSPKGLFALHFSCKSALSYEQES